MKKAFLSLAVVLVLGSFASAQEPAPKDPPISHLVISGSAVGFKGVNGTQPASILAAGLQLTKRVTVAYEQITVPSLNSRYQFGVANYTVGLDGLLGKKLSSKFVFDTSNINVTFTGGAGKLLTPKANHIAETFGAALSYPVAAHVSIQVFGYQAVHSPAQFGLIGKNYNQTVSTGFNFYF